MYMNFHCNDKMVMRLIYLYNRNSYTGKTTSLYIEAATIIFQILVNTTLAEIPWLLVSPGHEQPWYLLTMWDKQALAFHEVGFKLEVLSHVEK